MQLTGDRFTSASALFGNDLSTLPDFPAEIRAPAGTLAGVSAFQVHISDHDILTPGDAPERARGHEPGGAEGEHRRPRARRHAHRQRRRVRGAQPDQGRLRGQPAARRHAQGLQGLRGADDEPHARGGQADGRQAARRRALEELLRARRDLVDVHAPGRVDDRLDPARSSAPDRWSPRPTRWRSRRATTSARRPSCSSRPTRSSPPRCCPAPTRTSPATPRSAWGLIAASELAKLPIFLGSYPITPASDILHELSRHKNFGVRTLQAEDEIAGIDAALGAAFGGHLGVTTTSGPGIDLKSETIGLAVSLELPLLIIDIQRGGPSTGLPTKTEQSDLLHAMFGRHGEAPVPDRRGQEPVALLLRRDRGGAHRAEVPHAGVPAVRRLPRQRRPSRGACPTSSRSPTSACRSPPSRTLDGRVLALPARPRHARPPVGDPRHARASSTASAGSRRPTAPATSPTTPTTTSA